MKSPLAFGLGVVAGALTCVIVLAGIAVWWTLAKEERARVEKQQRVEACVRVDAEAQLFIKDHLPSITKALRENKPSLGEAHATLAMQAAGLAERASHCGILEGVIPGTNTSISAHHRKLYDLLHLTEIILNLWKHQPPSQMKYIESNLARMEKLHSEVTTGPQPTQGGGAK